MAFLLPKISTSPPLLTNKSPKSPNYPSPLFSSNLVLPPLRDAAAQDKPRGGGAQDSSTSRGGGGGAQDKKNKKKRDDFYLNLGVAVRTLRDDIPNLFERDLNYDIYREDITFIDPLNTFQGIENYRVIFWALRFHGRILFKEIGLEVFRVWQPSENCILIRWELQGVPRVPWGARGQFQGTSRYKVDRNGKIYEHKVDNLAFNFPRKVMRTATVMDLVGVATPNLMFWWEPLEDANSCPWVELYRAVRGTLEHEGRLPVGVGIDGLVTCS